MNGMRLDPEVAEYHLYLGHVRGKLENREEAIEAYRESTRLAPIRPEAWKGLGLMLYNVGRYSEARAALDAFMIENPRGKHGRIVYDLKADFGLDPDQARERFRFYFDRFEVLPES